MTSSIVGLFESELPSSGQMWAASAAFTVVCKGKINGTSDHRNTEVRDKLRP